MPIGDPIGPAPGFPLGTDLLGRDELSRLLYGARSSLTVGSGEPSRRSSASRRVVAAFRWRRIRLRTRSRPRSCRPDRDVPMRTTDAVLSFPVLLLAIALVAIVGPSLPLVVAVIAGVLWTGVARIVYGADCRAASDFVWPRRVGVSDRRISCHHVLPHLVPIIVVYATLGIASTGLFEATLSFLGVGIPLPAATWGRRCPAPRLLRRPPPRGPAGPRDHDHDPRVQSVGDALADALDPITGVDSVAAPDDRERVEEIACALGPDGGRPRSAWPSSSWPLACGTASSQPRRR